MKTEPIYNKILSKTEIYMISTKEYHKNLPVLTETCLKGSIYQSIAIP